MKSIAGWLVLAPLLTGCALPPPPQLPSEVSYRFEHRANGKPLRFDARDQKRTVQENVAVAQHEIYTSHGDHVGKDVVYQLRPVERELHTWNVYQGDKEIDALSALHIARNAAFETAYDAERARVLGEHARALELYEHEVKDAQGIKNAGTGLLFGGFAASLGSGAAFLATRDGKAESQSTVTTVTGVMAIGFLTVMVGGYFLRSKGIKAQDAAMREVEPLAQSSMQRSVFSGMETEGNMREAIGSMAPKEAPKEVDSESAPVFRMAKSLDPVLAAAIPDNPALGVALTGLWTPDASGSIPAKAHDVFERELLRSLLYLATTRGPVIRHEGNLVVHTSEASFLKDNGGAGKPEGIPSVKVLLLALAMDSGIYVAHETKKVSLFTTIDKADVARLLELATRPAKGSDR